MVSKVLVCALTIIAAVSCKPVCVIEGNLTGMEGDGWIDVIGGMSMPESKAYVVSGVPTSVLIDCSTGLIVGRDIYGDMLDEKLEEML